MDVPSRNLPVNASKKHGGRNSKLYRIWSNMKDRCNNPDCKVYSDYGGRGIKVCKEWIDDFSAFQKWALANGYKEGLTIDRKDNDKGYSPDNCRWTDRKIQGNNKRNCRYITYKGQRKPLQNGQRLQEYHMKRYCIDLIMVGKQKGY